ncbi:MAG: class I SAM-dependent methyltransferase, partial [Clostridiales bacterium]|nr:class I SAM-dependent methyltransferase [Clostridiales bacterium]
GYVTAVDIADEHYGSPETIGEARERIMKSKFSSNISIKLNYDIIKSASEFKDDEFDCVVLSHCLWYFPDYDFLEKIIKKVKRLSKKLCIAEWNPHIDNKSQFAHFRAAEIQAVCECFRESSDSNIRTLFFPRDIHNSIISAGYEVDNFEFIYSPDVHDGEWEVQMTISAYPRIIRNLEDMPERLKELLLSQIFDLRLCKDIKPLSSLVMKAVRID